jgi:hypothetical protein
VSARLPLRRTFVASMTVMMHCSEEVRPLPTRTESSSGPTHGPSPSHPDALSTG